MVIQLYVVKQKSSQLCSQAGSAVLTSELCLDLVMFGKFALIAVVQSFTC
jgi:hypothetical protein